MSEPERTRVRIACKLLRMPQFDLLIIGGGLASARAIKSFRESGGEGSIGLVSKDETLPYHRPPLSKRFLRGETRRSTRTTASR